MRKDTRFRMADDVTSSDLRKFVEGELSRGPSRFVIFYGSSIFDTIS